jgi:hypothetical protein
MRVVEVRIDVSNHGEVGQHAGSEHHDYIADEIEQVRFQTVDRAQLAYQLRRRMMPPHPRGRQPCLRSQRWILSVASCVAASFLHICYQSIETKESFLHIPFYTDEVCTRIIL